MEKIREGRPKSVMCDLNSEKLSVSSFKLTFQQEFPENLFKLYDSLAGNLSWL